MALTDQTVKAVALALPILSIIVTICRLTIRALGKRLWWDDAAIAFAMVIQFLQIIFTEIRYEPQDHSNGLMVAAYYMAAESFYGVIWFSRISIMLTIVRISVAKTERRILLGIASAFGIILTALVFQVVGECERNTAWKQALVPQCDLGEDVAIAQTITIVISDSLLIATPIRMVYRVNLPTSQKIRLIAVFMSTSITTAVSLVHIYYLLKYGGVDEIFAAVVEMSITLIVASLSVLVAFCSRIGTDNQNSSSSGSRSIITFGSIPIRLTRRRRPHDPLTPTIDIGVEYTMDTFSEHQVKLPEEGYSQGYSEGVSDAKVSEV